MTERALSDKLDAQIERQCRALARIRANRCQANLARFRALVEEARRALAARP